MRFLRAVCGRHAALCGETEGRTPTRDATSRVIAPSFLCNPQRQRVRCEKAGLRHAFWDSARRMSLKTMRLARFPSASALPTRKKGRTPTRDAASRVVAPPSSAIRSGGFAGTLSGIRRAECLSKPCALHGFQARRLCETQKRPHPGAGCGLPGCSPLLPLQSAATACALQESGPPARFPGFGAPNVSQNHALCMASKRVGFAKRKKGRTPARDAASALSFRRWRCFGCGSCGRRCRRGRPAPRACRTRRCARPG